MSPERVFIFDVHQSYRDVLLLSQVCEIIESPLFLKLNPMTKHTDVSPAAFSVQAGENAVVGRSRFNQCLFLPQLPVSVYESVIDIINGEVIFSLIF